MESVQITKVIQTKALQGVGKIRRLVMVHARREEVEQQIASRKGDCNRCGACCKIVYRCPFLGETEDGYHCRIYENRAAQCRMFPMNERDLRELGGDCSYYF